jgi:TorA maturation chaperone TorD
LDPADVAEEDRARGECYALISRLFYAPPDADLLQRLGGPMTLGAGGTSLQDSTPEGANALSAYEQALAAFQRACRSADPEAVRQEFDDLFVGAGKALVTPYTSGYTLPNAPDRHLVALRERLAAFGLVRAGSVFEMEDHVSAVCDVMRWLIEHDRPLDAQRAFFDEFVDIGLRTFCDAIEASRSASFYRTVAALARAFLEVEKEAFALYERP